MPLISSPAQPPPPAPPEEVPEAEPHRPLRVVFAAGGTGGHIFPALTVAAALHDTCVSRVLPPPTITFIGTPTRLEATVVPNHHQSFVPVSAPSLRRPVVHPGNLLLPIRLPLSVLRTANVLCRLQPDVIFATGGYVSLPTAIVGLLMRVPVVVHEPNALPGVANRLIVRLAYVLYRFYDSLRWWSRPRRRRFGSGQDITHLDHVRSPTPLHLLAGHEAGRRRLIRSLANQRIDMEWTFSSISLCPELWRHLSSWGRKLGLAMRWVTLSFFSWFDIQKPPPLAQMDADDVEVEHAGRTNPNPNPNRPPSRRYPRYRHRPTPDEDGDERVMTTQVVSTPVRPLLYDVPPCPSFRTVTVAGSGEDFTTTTTSARTSSSRPRPSARPGSRSVHVLVLGGSLGAEMITAAALTSVVTLLVEARCRHPVVDLTATVQVGAGHPHRVVQAETFLTSLLHRANHRDLQNKYVDRDRDLQAMRDSIMIVPFVEDMVAAYAEAESCGGRHLRRVGRDRSARGADSVPLRDGQPPARECARHGEGRRGYSHRGGAETGTRTGVRSDGADASR